MSLERSLAMDRSFLWYRANGDGTADVLEDTPDVRAMVDADGRNVYGNPEGAILHGGVLACAFKRKVEATYDAMAWLTTGERIHVGELVTIEITATGDITSARKGA
jgi:hypothetical protein